MVVVEAPSRATVSSRNALVLNALLLERGGFESWSLSLSLSRDPEVFSFSSFCNQDLPADSESSLDWVVK